LLSNKQLVKKTKVTYKWFYILCKNIPPNKKSWLQPLNIIFKMLWNIFSLNINVQLAFNWNDEIDIEYVSSLYAGQTGRGQPGEGGRRGWALFWGQIKFPVLKEEE